MTDQITRLFESTEDFIYRFKDHLPSYGEQLRVFEEETTELENAVWDYIQGKDTKSHIAKEFADVAVTAIGLCMQADLVSEDLISGINFVIDELNNKTLDTHYLNEKTGKITKRGK